MLYYPIELTPDDNGTFLVTCPDLPEVTTFGETPEGCRLNASHAISEAIAARLHTFDDIPRPSTGGPSVTIGLQLSLKVQLFWALHDAGKTRADLVRLTGWHRPQVDRLFDANHATRLDQFEIALAELNAVAFVSVEAA